MGKLGDAFLCRSSASNDDGKIDVSPEVFFGAMFGRNPSTQAATEPLNDPFNAITVNDEFTDAKLQASWKRTSKTGLIDEVEPFILDCLRRRSGLKIPATIFRESSIPPFASTLPEDLLASLMLKASNKRRIGRLVARNTGIALPWMIEDPAGNLIDLSECLYDQLSQPGSHLILWLGTAASEGRGKTALLNKVFPNHFRNAEPGSGSSRQRSIDVRIPFVVNRGAKLKLGLEEAILIDVNRVPIKHETVQSLMKHASLVVINAYPSDKADDILSLVKAAGSSVVVLLRDYVAGSRKGGCLPASNLQSSLDCTVIQVPRVDLANAEAVAQSVKKQLLPVFQECLPSPCLDVIRKKSNHPTLSKSALEISDLLHTAAESGQLRSVIFPFSALQAKQLGLARKERTLKEEGGTQGLPILADIHRQLGLINAQISDHSRVKISPVLQWFCDTFILKRPGNFSLTALAKVLDDWKTPLLEPLFVKRREYLDDSSPEANEKLVGVNRAMDELEITVDSFWTELEVMITYYGQDNPHLIPVPKDLVYKRYAEAIGLDGFPLQLLKGSPMHLADPIALKGVLSQLSSSGSQVLVVSVIGAQSSAKSTLLNFLFGCEFETRSGRCTKGLYASFLKLSDGRILAVLDSEGLLSVEAAADHSEYGGSEIFDGQMTLLAMACSHLVLINHKGEISRQLQDLLEVCMFAMKHLKVANFQPLVSFILRDQHDRSPSVHEDTLRHMRRHLTDCASRLGIKLEEILRLDASSIHLLPSAFSTEKTGASEVEVINSLFSSEVLKVRSRILQTLSQERPFDNLSQWVAHASIVWETLVQFGHNLLHYKTIQEIEIKREANHIASDVIRDTLEQRFKPKASDVINDYKEKLTSTRLEDLDALDIEVSGSLLSLKQQETARIVAEFERLTTDKRFTESIKQPEKERLSPALDFAHDNLVYTWKLLLRQARDGQQAQGLWSHFCEAMDRMIGAEHRAVTEAEARDMFDKEWVSFEQQSRERLDNVKRDRAGIAYEVSVIFNHALQKISREREDFALLKEVGVVMGDDKGTLIHETEDEWKSKYIIFDNQKALQNDQLRKNIGKDLNIVRELVGDFLATVEDDIYRTGSINEAAAIEWLRKSHDLVTSEADRRVRFFQVKRPQLLSALHLQLRHSVVAYACAAEEDKHKRQLELLTEQKRDLENHLVTMAKSNASDVERAQSFADRFHMQLTQWLDCVVTSFAAEVRSTVLDEMPDTAKAHERAFQQSFGARNWIEVLEYCLDVNAYLEKLFLVLFYRRQVAVVAARQPQLESRVAEMYNALRGCAQDWSRETKGSSETISSFRSFLDSMATSSSEDSSIRAVLSVFPTTINFEVKDTKIFATTFAASLAEKFAQVFPKTVDERVTKCLNEQSVEAWALLKGCAGRCPLCGSKCDKLGDHPDHSCSHHLFPAFHGWMDRLSGKPSLSLCQSEEVHQGTYQCRDGVWRPLQEYLDDSHKSWCPFPQGFAENQKNDENILKAAWVNTRRALEKYFKPMKGANPEEWECFLENDRALTEADLEKAKKTIKALRAKKWSASQQ